MTRQEALDAIEDATANIHYFKAQLAKEEARLFNAKLASGDYMMNRKGDLVRVQAA